MGTDQITFGDTVRIRTTPETEAAGLAGKAGTVYGETTPSVTGVDVLGELREDRALQVQVEVLDRGAWFAPDVLEFIDHGAGTTATLDGVPKQWIRKADGSWGEAPRSLPLREWFSWLRHLLSRLVR